MGREKLYSKKMQQFHHLMQRHSETLEAHLYSFYLFLDQS
ncbi:Unknown protein sequence [Pseudomonas savastanoi pv. phaseolicola]|nr:Unknown protein sequence [Pseudomonas savastanoi pv. phaseolicola]